MFRIILPVFFSYILHPYILPPPSSCFMKSMLKRFLLLVLITVMGISLFHVFAVCAQEEAGPLIGGLDGAAKLSGLHKEGDAEEILAQEVGKYIRLALGFVGVVLLIIVMYAGVSWMTAAGKPENVDSAKRMIISAMVGMAVTLLAYQVTQFIISRIGDTL